MIRSLYLIFILHTLVMAGNTKIAIMPFAGGDGQPELSFLSKVLADAFGSALANQENTTLVERQQLKSFLQNHQIEEALTNASLSEDLAAADMILVGSYGGNSQSLHIEARLIQSGSAKVLATQTIHATMEETFRQIPHTAAQLYKKALGKEIGMLRINSTPMGAKVYLDGVEMGSTPLFLDQIPTGPHNLKITRTQSKSCEYDLLIPKGDTTKIDCALKSNLDQWLLGLRLGGVFSNWDMNGQDGGAQTNLQGSLSVRYLALGLKATYMGENLSRKSNYQYSYKIPLAQANQKIQSRELSASQSSVDVQLFPFMRCKDFCPYLGSGVGLIQISSQAEDSMYHSTQFGTKNYLTTDMNLGVELFPHSSVGLYFEVQSAKVWGFSEEQLESVNFRGKPSWKNQTMDLWISGIHAGIRFGVGL